MSGFQKWLAFFLLTILSCLIHDQAGAEVLYGVTHQLGSPYTSTLLSFDSSNPGTILTSTTISGGPSGSTLGNPDQFTITGIDFRPSTGQLYGVANRSGFAQRAYTIDPQTG